MPLDAQRHQFEPRDEDELTYEDDGERAHDVPQDGERPRTPAETGPMHEPEKKAAPAHKGLRDAPPPDESRASGDPKIWDEASQRYMERHAHDRKRASQKDYDDLRRGPGSGVTRGDSGVD